MKWISLISLLLTSQITFANVINDSDLSTPIMLPLVASPDLKVDTIDRYPIRRNAVAFKAVIVQDDKETEIKGLSFNLTLNSNVSANGVESIQTACETGDETYIATAKLKLEKFQINGPRSRRYNLKVEGKCGEGLKLIFKYNSLAGQFFGIWNLASKITHKFKAIGRNDFLRGKMGIIYPASGDYYNGRVNVTQGYQWDVVGHEIGHSIYSESRIGRSQGGRHRIDECYTKTLAFSEGWASFFSAWVSVDLNDPDAKFRYMVQRRAPLEIEHVPADVCYGPTNEWRVYSFLWDLIDLNNDNENVNISFLDLWDLSIEKKFRSITEYKDELLDSGFDPVLINVVWDQNILGF
ncbi:hypothetical protein A9Q84_18515 [Halobacteriovorax marinus]|uniref:Uncharacterized protein n=1 Tax=Halobacteriovorax marinus TaxID=97084 RepID=A0A1Y5F7U2_9BACT|nr:hypothetical protein A9Q84_18515 [Halobacteriovorax marinus]